MRRVVLLFVMTLLMLTGCLEKKEMTDEEKLRMFSYEDLSFIAEVDYDRVGCQRYQVKTNLDNSLEYEYDFDSELNENNGDILYITSEIDVSSTLAMAKETYEGKISAYKIGAGIVDVDFIKIEGIETDFDQAYLCVKESEGNPIGNVFVIREGNDVYSLLLDGIYTDESDIDMVEMITTLMVKE